MTNSYLQVSLLLARKGWKHFDKDNTDGTIGTEDTELTEVDSGKGLGTEVGDIPDTVKKIRITCEHYCRYVLFRKDAIPKLALPGPQATLIGPAGTELTAGGAVEYVAGKDFDSFVVSSSWDITGNTSADGTGA